MNKSNNILKERRMVLTGIGKAVAGFWSWLFWFVRQAGAAGNKKYMGDVMKLPEVNTKGVISVEKAIAQRRTVRSYSSRMLSLAQVAQLLWAAQGITGKRGRFRAAPSAGALYPMDVYVAAGKSCVEQMQAGVYLYKPKAHTLSQVAENDLREDTARAAFSQMWMARAPVCFIITAEYNRVEIKYGRRGHRYAVIEAGHIGQNLFLQAEALGLKAGIVGAFHDQKLHHVLNLNQGHEPLLIMPAGYAA